MLYFYKTFQSFAQGPRQGPKITSIRVKDLFVVM